MAAALDFVWLSTLNAVAALHPPALRRPPETFRRCNPRGAQQARQRVRRMHQRHQAGAGFRVALVRLGGRQGKGSGAATWERTAAAALISMGRPAGCRFREGTARAGPKALSCAASREARITGCCAGPLNGEAAAVAVLVDRAPNSTACGPEADGLELVELPVPRTMTWSTSPRTSQSAAASSTWHLPCGDSMPVAHT